MRGLWRFRAGCWSLGTVGLGAQLRHVVRRCSCFWRSSADAWLEVSKREPGTHYLSLERSKGWKCSKSRHKPVQVHHLYLIRNFQFMLYCIIQESRTEEAIPNSPYGRCRSKASPGLWHATSTPSSDAPPKAANKGRAAWQLLCLLLSHFETCSSVNSMAVLSL